MGPEDTKDLHWEIENAIKKWHYERPLDRPYGGTRKDRDQAIRRLVRRVIYGPPKPGTK